MRARHYAGFNPVCIYDEHDEASTVETDGIAIERRFGHLVSRVRSREIGELWLVLPRSEDPRVQRFVSEWRIDVVNIGVVR
ncbi:undecaprenyl-phosphate glucose phosphotransferase, partial [Burkholderia pseudomallei]